MRSLARSVRYSIRVPEGVSACSNASAANAPGASGCRRFRSMRQACTGARRRNFRPQRTHPVAGAEFFLNPASSADPLKDPHRQAQRIHLGKLHPTLPGLEEASPGDRAHATFPRHIPRLKGNVRASLRFHIGRPRAVVLAHFRVG